MSTKNKNIIPILNFNFGEADVLSQEEINHLYKEAVKICSKEFGHIELSLSSDRAYESFSVIIETTKDTGAQISFGSVNSLEQFSFLKKMLKEVSLRASAKQSMQKVEWIASSSPSLKLRRTPRNDGPIKIFSPAYNAELDQAIKESTGFKYIPGIFSVDELDRVKGFDELKIFPAAIDQKYNLRKALQAPYPELTKALYQQKILEFSEENFKSYGISDKVYEEDGFEKIRARNEDQEVVLITKPYDFQKIRSRFLFDPKLKIAFINDSKKDYVGLISSLSSRKLYLTGLGALGSQEPRGNLVYATRVFNNIVLDLLSGSVKIDHVGELMERELKAKYSSQWNATSQQAASCNDNYD